MKRTAAYTVITEPVWRNLQALLQENEDYTIHRVSPSQVVAVHRTEMTVVMDVGCDLDREYYWAIFSIPGEGCSLLENALLVDTEPTVQ